VSVDGRRFRFAPTPSRPLHVGSALAALLGWAAARAAGGAFVLRIEDIDQTRCRPEHEASVLSDLRWLGLDWDEGPDVGGPLGPYRQSDRLHLYDDALQSLLQGDAGYICGCSRADVRQAQRAPTAEQESAALPYPGTCRGLEQRLDYAPDRGGLRLHVDRASEQSVVHWEDPWGDPTDEDVRQTCGDFLLGRPGAPTYQLAVVVDDIAMKITDVVRGSDLCGSTARQILLFRALSAPPPSFSHHPLLLDPQTSRKLSKRDGASTLASLRELKSCPKRLIAQLGVAIGLFAEDVLRATPADIQSALMERAPHWHDAAWIH